jgi:hypothetical protein
VSPFCLGIVRQPETIGAAFDAGINFFFLTADIAFVRYNSGHAGARRDLFPHLAQPGSTRLFGFKSTFGYVRPEQMTAMGLPGEIYWQPEITDHCRFALSRPELDGLLIAPGTPKELHALAEALEKGPLDEEGQTYLMHAALVAQGRARVKPDA